MIKNISLISVLSLLIATSAFAAETATEDSAAPEISSETKIKINAIQNKSKIVTDINTQINDSRNNRLMQEYVRNSNALKEMMGEPVQDIDAKDKKALSEFIQQDIGLQKEIVQVKETATTAPEKPARRSAAELLK